MKPIESGVILADIHVPTHIDLNPVIKYIRDLCPDYVLFLGDQVHLSTLFSWHSRKPDTIDWDAVRREIYGLDGILRKVEAAAPIAEKHFWIGNHEKRIYEYAKAYPAMRRNLGVEYPDPVKILGLKQRGYAIHQQNDIIPFGKLYATHGYLYTDLHAKKALADTEVNLVAGHVHTMQVYAKTTRVDSMPKAMYSLPCLCNTNPEYMAGAPNRWVNGFGVFFLQPNGNYNLYITTIINGVFIGPNGRLYK